MKRQILFNDLVEIAYSENEDGNMRFLGEEDEQKIIQNQIQLGKCVGLIGENIARINTIYGNRMYFTDYREVILRNLEKFSIMNSESLIPVSDGIVTRELNAGILLPLADCLGIVVFDGENLGLLHAGRQNIEQSGPKKFIEFFAKQFNSKPENIKVYFSPYALEYHINKLNKNLGEAAKEQLLEAGILPENITNPQIDTVKNGQLPSYSNGDKTRRFAIIVKRRNNG